MVRLFGRYLGALWIAAALAAVQPAGLLAAEGQAAIARFEVTTRVVNPDLRAFAATTPAVGNGRRQSAGGAFEPVVVRNMFLAQGGDTRRIEASLRQLSRFNSWASGAFDGAEVEVLRIEDGVFRRVRIGRIPRGGYNASGWYSGNAREMIPGEAGRHVFYWDNYNRTDATYYFALRSIDDRGRMSGFSAPAGISKPGWARKSDAETVMVKAPQGLRGGGRLDPPADLRATLRPDGGVDLTWTPVPGAAGYRLYQSDIPPEAMRGAHIAFDSDGPEVRDGDLVLVRHEFREARRPGLITNRVWEAREPKRVFTIGTIGLFSDAPGGGNWQLVPHGPDTPVSEGGQTFLRLEPAPDETVHVGGPAYSGTGQDYYDVLDPSKPYRIEIWARGTREVSASIAFKGPFGGRKSPEIGPFALTLGPEWKHYGFEFRVPRLYDGDKPGRIDLDVTGPGRIDVDNFRVYEAGRPFMAASDAEVRALRDSGTRLLRTHAWTKTELDSYDLEQLTNPPGVMNSSQGNTLAVQLELMAAAGVDPWFQIEPHFSAEEWLGFLEYLAAPFDPATDDRAAKPWAAKRHAQGRAAPWVEAFDEVLFEIGNETWNRLFRPWTFPAMTDSVSGRSYSPGAVYGLYQEYVLSILRQSPYWPEIGPKFSAVIGGRAINDYGVDAIARSPRSRYLTHAAYIGGRDENEGPVSPSDPSYLSVLTAILQTEAPRIARRLEDKGELDTGRTDGVELGTYEAGPGFALFGPNRSRLDVDTRRAQELVMKSAAAGAAVLDAFLLRASNGYTLQNYFVFGEGRNWASHTHWYHGGHALPAWDLLSLVNTELLGDVLAVDPVSAPTIDLPEKRRREAVRDAPLVAAYATRAGDRLSVVLVSRRVPGILGADDDGVSRVDLALPIQSAARITRIDQTGTYRSQNYDAAEVRLARTDLPVPPDPGAFAVEDLPPGEAVILVFDGVRWTGD